MSWISLYIIYTDYNQQIVVNQPKRRRLFPLNKSLQKLGRSVARRKFRSVAGNVLAHEVISKEVVWRGSGYETRD